MLQNVDQDDRPLGSPSHDLDGFPGDEDGTHPEGKFTLILLISPLFLQFSLY